MNHAYKVVWNNTKSLFEVASELGKHHGKSASAVSPAAQHAARSRFDKRLIAAAVSMLAGGMAMADTPIPVSPSLNIATDTVLAPGTYYQVLGNSTLTINSGVTLTTQTGSGNSRSYIHFGADGAKLVNNGTYNNNTYLDMISNAVSSGGTSIENNGIINNAGAIASQYAIPNITNTGTINNITSDASIYGNIITNNGGTISNQGRALINTYYLNNSNDGSTRGTIHNDANLVVMKVLNNQGDFYNEQSGNLSISARYSPESSINNLAGGRFENAGIITSYSGDISKDRKIVNAGNFINTNHGSISVYVSNTDAGVLTNDGKIAATIVADGTSIINNRSGASISLDPTGSYYSPKNFQLNGQSVLNNAGTITINANGDDVNQTYYTEQYLLIDKDATVNNTGMIEFKDAAVHNPYMDLKGQFNNNAGGIVKIGNNVAIGFMDTTTHGMANTRYMSTTGVFNNAGTIQGTAGSTTDLFRFVGTGGTLIMQAGSTFADADIGISHDQQGAGNTLYMGDATIRFTGASTFNPNQIRFDNLTSYHNILAPASTVGTLNLDVASGVTQQINSAIVKTTESSGSNTYSRDGLINKLGNGTLILNGQNTYTQGTNINAGTLYLGAAPGSTASITGQVNVGNSTTFGGNGKVLGAVNVATGGHISAGLGLNNVGTLSMDSLTLHAGSQVDFDMSNTSSDLFNVLGNLETNGATVNVNNVGDITTGLMRQLFQYGGGSNHSLVIGDTPAGTTANDFSITDNHSGAIYVNANTSLINDTVLKFWNPTSTTQSMGSGGNGTWSATSTNWTNRDGSSAVGVLDPAANLAVFAGNAGTVTINGTVAAKGLQFLNDYTLRGGRLTLDSGVTGQTYISTGGSASAGNLVNIDGIIDGSHGINKTDGGTLVLTGYNTYTGGNIVSGGVLEGDTISIRGDIDVHQGAAVRFNQSAYATFANTISGSGQLLKTGAGELALTGANSYSGGTVISAGLLSGDSTSLTGDIAITNSASALKFDQNSNGSYSGSVSGTGKLIKDGSGTLTITGANSHSGGTEVNAGSLQGNSASIQGNVAINSGAALNFNQSADGTYAGNISGSGTVDKSGAAALTVSGNIAAATINVQQGSLVVGNSATINSGVNVASGAALVNHSNAAVNGTVALQNGAGMSVDANSTLNVNDISFAGNNTLTVSGISHIGAGTVTQTIIQSATALSGDFSSTAITGLSNSSDFLTTSVAKDSSNTRYDLTYGLSWFSHDAATVSGRFTLAGATDAFTVDGALSDVSATMPVATNGWDGNSLHKKGAGTLILNGVNSYTGITDVEAGKLVVGGSAADAAATVAGDVSVSAGATLGGHGQILGNVLLQSGATITPGNSIGTLTVNSITFNPGSVYEFEANPDGSADKINVVTSATINGGTVSVIGGAGTWADSTNYTILSAASVSGTFNSVTSNLAFLTPTLSYDANNVYLNLARNSASFQSVAGTYNQRQTGAAIGSLASGSPITAAIVSMDADSARRAYDNLSGEIYASTNSALLYNSRYVRDALNNHLQGDAGGAQGAGWVNVWGHQARFDGDGNAAETKNNGEGLLAGVDASIGSNSRLGGAIGYEHSKIESNDGRNAQSEADALHLALYASTKAGGIDLRAGLAYSYLDIDTDRSIWVDSLRHTNKSSYNGDLWQGFVEGSHDFQIGQHASVTPYLNLAYASLSTDDVKEQSSASALQVNGQNDDATYTTLGVRGSMAAGDSVKLYADLGWQHAFGDTNVQTVNRFSAGSSAFTVKGTPVAEDSAVIGLGLNVSLSKAASLNVGYQGAFGGGTSDNRAYAGFNYSF